MTTERTERMNRYEEARQAAAGRYEVPADSVRSFRRLVGLMRKAEKRYWEERERGAADSKMLHRAMELEKRVDAVIADALERCPMERIPVSVDGLFFKQVVLLRQAMGRYFKERKKQWPSKAVLQGYRREIRQHQQYVDRSLEQFLDEDMRREGYDLYWAMVNSRLVVLHVFPNRRLAETEFLELYERGETAGLRLVKARCRKGEKPEVLTDGCWRKTGELETKGKNKSIN